MTLCSQAKSSSFSDEGFLLPGIRIHGAGRERFCGSFSSGNAFAIALLTLLWAAGEALGYDRYLKGTSKNIGCGG